MSQVALVVKNSPANVGDIKRCGFDPWVGKIPWRRAWQPTPVFLPRESHGQRSLVHYGPRGHRESDSTEVTYHVQSWGIFLQRVLNCPDCGYTETAFTQTKTQSCDRKFSPMLIVCEVPGILSQIVCYSHHISEFFVTAGWQRTHS